MSRRQVQFIAWTGALLACTFSFLVGFIAGREFQMGAFQ